MSVTDRYLSPPAQDARHVPHCDGDQVRRAGRQTVQVYPLLPATRGSERVTVVVVVGIVAGLGVACSVVVWLADVLLMVMVLAGCVGLGVAVRRWRGSGRGDAQ